MRVLQALSEFRYCWYGDVSWGTLCPASALWGGNEGQTYTFVITHDTRSQNITNGNITAFSCTNEERERLGRLCGNKRDHFSSPLSTHDWMSSGNFKNARLKFVCEKKVRKYWQAQLNLSLCPFQRMTICLQPKHSWHDDICGLFLDWG